MYAETYAETYQGVRKLFVALQMYNHDTLVSH